jgi:CheY-like chemotaxis protein
MVFAEETKTPYHFTVVDDDDKTIFFIERVLLHAFPASDIISFADGEDALRYLKQNHTDFLITDFQMARMNGDELIQRLRLEGNAVPAIMMSSSPHAQEAAVAAGVIFLDKGKIVEHLADLIRALLSV